MRVDAELRTAAVDPRLLDYYNRELAHLREMGGEFAREFPKVAARLGMEGLDVADPYVERLMEGFAFVAARVQLKIDAEFPRFTQQLLEIVFPQYLAPMPSCMIVALEPNMAEPELAKGVRLPRGAALRGPLARGQDTACEFRTAHDVTLWPISISSARCFDFAPDLPLGQLASRERIAGGLRIELVAHGAAPFSGLACDFLSLHLTGSDEVAGPLHEAIAAHCVEVVVVDAGSPKRVLARLPRERVIAEGFDPSQALLPHARRSFDGYRLLREYFACPQRFRFVRVEGLREAFRHVDARKCELVFLFDRLAPGLQGAVDEKSISLHATPAVNLFPRRADRIHLGDGVFEHHLVVDRTRPMDYEVHSISSVIGLGDDTATRVEFSPFYGKLVRQAASAPGAFFTLRRTPRMLSEAQRRHGPRTGYVGTEVFLSLVDEDEAPYSRTIRQLAVEVLATNRDLPLLLPVGALAALSLDETAPVSAIRVLSGPTRPRSNLVEGGYAWRLISQLSLNYLSLVDGAREGAAAAALREQLMLYVDPGEAAQRRQVDALVGLRATPVVRRLPAPGPITFGRGLGVELEFEESAFGGAGCHLLGSVLERFLAHHQSLNSFIETRLVSQSRGEIARWPTRTGTRALA